MKLYRFFVQHTVLSLFLFFGSLVCVLMLGYSLPHMQFIVYDLTLVFVWIVLYTALILYPLRIYKQSFDTCTPEKGVEFADSMLQGIDIYKRIQKSAAGLMPRGVLIDRAMFLTLLGRFDEALAVYTALERFCGTLPNKYMAIVYHNLMMLACAQGNAAAAQFYFEQESALLQNSSVRFVFSFAAVGKTVQEILLSDEISLSVCCGDLARAEALYRQYEATAKPRKHELMINRVYDAYEIGEMYYRMGNFAQAAPRLQFAADNGGTTFYCARAKELLAAMQQMNTNTDESIRDIP